MRPTSLTPLFASAQFLDGVGPRLDALLAKALKLPPGVAKPRVLDLLLHFPTHVIDRRAEPKIRDAVPGAIATFRVRVLLHRPPPPDSPKTPYRVACDDDTGRIHVVFFRADPKFIEKQLPPGSERYISGRVEAWGETLQISHPDYIVPIENRDDLPLLEPVYPLTAGLSPKVLSKAVRAALGRVPDLPEWQDRAWLAARGWPPFAEALARLHRPESAALASPSGAPWQRLAYDELLANQLALALVRQSEKAPKGRALKGDGAIRRRIAAALPFALTPSQQRALAEIEADMGARARMLRLLQGDVGSGKTIVALMAMALAAESGTQAVLMAPTEVLARQHFETMSPLAAASGLRPACLTGREKAASRREILGRLREGGIDILIGTHALFQADVTFRDLGFAVIDEQHRFGVHQRLALQAKGEGAPVDVLVMTATPIPRTLLMTHYGDLDVSRLTEKPAGRKPVTTTAVSAGRVEEVIDGIRRAVDRGAQVYWVCPLIEASDFLDLATAEARFAHLKQTFGGKVGLMHGGLAPAAKDATMAAFAEGRLSILVATTVIEVGVNVPNATVMVIEHAERFGLAQLHQLRGRVGRGDRQSYCILLYKGPLGEAAKARLDMMRETEDGFLIAEKDLALRGGGEMLGVRQSGLPEFRVAGVPGFETLLAAARDDAKLVMSADPALSGARGEALRALLYLFERDEAVRLFRTA